MRYAYQDLGEQPKGNIARVHLRGSSANVMLMDSMNFRWYRHGHPFLFTGGYHVVSPVDLEIPEDGRWYVVLDLGGYTGRVKGAVEVFAPDEVGAA